MNQLINSIATGRNRGGYGRGVCGVLMAASAVLLLSSGPGALGRLLRSGPAPAATQVAAR